MPHQRITARRGRPLPDKRNGVSSVLDEARVWIGPVILILLILWAGKAISDSGEAPAFERPAREYVGDYEPPVAPSSLLAFIKIDSAGAQKPKALFLTPTSVIYFNPNISDVLGNSDDTSTARMVEINIRGITQAKLEGSIFSGSTLIIRGDAGKTLELDVPGKRLADFFLTKLQSQGARGVIQ